MGEELRPESDELDRKLLGEYVDELDDSIFELIVDDEELIELDDSSHWQSEFIWLVHGPVQEREVSRSVLSTE